MFDVNSENFGVTEFRKTGLLQAESWNQDDPGTEKGGSEVNEKKCQNMIILKPEAFKFNSQF